LKLDEKTLTDAETKEKERLVKSMKSNKADFEKRYPGRGEEVMYATATKMAKKIAEQKCEQIDEVAPLVIGAGLAAAAAAPYLLKKFAKPAIDKAIDKPATGSGGLIDKMKQRRDAINQMNSYQPEGELVDETSTSTKMSLEDYMMVKKDGSRVRMPGDPPKAKKEPGGYDYTPTKKEKENMKKTPKTKIGSRFD
jgi:hypothetical protein